MVLPICLDFTTDHASSASSVKTVAGWGKTTNANLADIEDFVSLGVSARTLQKLEVTMVQHARCRAFFTQITREQICAGGEEGEQMWMMGYYELHTIH